MGNGGQQAPGATLRQSGRSGKAASFPLESHGSWMEERREFPVQVVPGESEVRERGGGGLGGGVFVPAQGAQTALAQGAGFVCVA